MRVHHINCMSFHLAVPGVTHCLLVEMDECLVLIDSGLGMKDHTDPTPLVTLFKLVNGNKSDITESTYRQVIELGYMPEDVKHIILTHLHIDHAGGLPDFPWAKVHVNHTEYEAAMHRKMLSLREHFYIREHWAHDPQWVLHTTAGEKWFGLDCVRVVADSDCQILLVPLVGHSRGHSGVAVGTHDGWLLHCGDAFVRQFQIDPQTHQRAYQFGFSLFEKWFFAVDKILYLRELARKHGDEVQMFNAHDRYMFARMKAG